MTRRINKIEKTEKGFTINTNSDLAYDEFFTVTYDVSLANAQLSGKNLSNTATTQADNGDKKTDENIVTVTKPALEISKISNKKIYSTGEIAKYTLVVKQTVENAVAKNVVVSDDFNTTKISKPTNVKVVDMNGQVLNNAEITMTDKGFNIETNANLAYNEFFMITYDVGMLNAELSGIDIVNTAKTSAENANEVNVNNTVNVTIPKLAIKKDVNKTAFSSNETAQYKLVVTQTVENAIAKNVVITDSFDKENIVPGHVKVINSEGKELENVDVTITKNGFTINTASDLAYNEFFTVTYDAKLSNAKLVGETIKNTANAKADNADMVEDAKSITIGNEYAYNSTEIKIVVIDGVNSVRIDWVAEGNRYPVTYSVGYDNTVIIPNFLRRRFIVSVEYTFAGSMAGIQYAYETRVFEIRS